MDLRLYGFGVELYGFGDLDQQPFGWDVFVSCFAPLKVMQRMTASRSTGTFNFPRIH
jgi:hypothetical protein